MSLSRPTQEQLNIAGANARRARIAEFPIRLDEEQLELLVRIVLGTIISGGGRLICAISGALLESIENEYIDRYSIGEYSSKLGEAGFTHKEDEQSYVLAMLKMLKDPHSYQDIYNFYYAKRGSEKYGSFESFVQTLSQEVRIAREKLERQ